ncbi:DNA-O6-methylguanine--protein-cysteine S-methyltransferase /Transcriptional regulator Ada [Arboricoccus pini]|uniref:methylated-DNA--[protein]-cysteine S-methyltransferase n=1 Tax=Arboricoccus pini TaxID=1963835 RepID=A0A212RGE8_9PROT|nr:bifunctional DNA-binding transcriptional regulator/O6-methylguanine-DNA methyltransferase Ada [Arboricoccus pini]SNB71303.1 DNA-O6-methylguanine--protein-cysteine S-methyltransferase /Transcriptional regulator Ada [Arboricoccus pini]
MVERVEKDETAAWSHAVDMRDAGFDGRFVYAVRTTGVFCRPSCPARRPKAENTAFFATPEEALAAGYRPCRRCQPMAAPAARGHADVIAAACRRLESAEDLPDLTTLAREAGFSPYHFHRLFKAATGLTPRAYGAAVRARALRHHLADSGSITAALYAAGFNSSGRFYENTDAMLGMTPSAFRQGGEAALIRFAIGQSSLGAVLVACSLKGVCAILLGDSPDSLIKDLQDQFPRAELVGGEPGFEAMIAAVLAFAENPLGDLALPLDVRGTAFQERVWQQLRAIPLGKTASYAEIAQAIGMPRAVRAVARACATNRIALAIPCHRVVRSDGDPSGYRWGVERKKELLARERKASDHGTSKADE